MSENVFGVGKTFRDSTECRAMALQYMCLTWSSNNDQYLNYCAMPEQEYLDPVKNIFRTAPRPPCKSFCVQVAQVCANDPKFILTCNDILCPPLVEEDCNPDPFIVKNGELVPLAANLGCDVPYFSDPYAPKSGALRNVDKTALFDGSTEPDPTMIAYRIHDVAIYK
eukprot:gene32543-40155_t